MNAKHFAMLGLCLISSTALADQSLYCPQNHGYINTGMTQAQVMSSCGQPLSKQQSNRPVTQKVPVQQLIYNNMGTRHGFYGVWSVPMGSGGTQLQVDVINNKISAIQVNGGNSNAFSVCGGINLQVGDNIGQVYGACGNPSTVNNTFINQVVQGNSKPEIWIYQPTEYQSPVSLTFVNGKLQSID